MLKSFADNLQEQGYETHLIEASETAPLDQVVVALEQLNRFDGLLAAHPAVF